MKTASVSELRQNFPRVLAWIEAGQEVTITRRQQAVARLVPLPWRERRKRRMPDIMARLKEVFGTRVISDKAMSKIVRLNTRM